MKFTSIPDGFPPNHRRPLLIPALSIVLSMSIGLQALHAQTTGSNNVPPKKDIYELQKITATPKGDKPLPIKLETYLKWLKKVNGEPESAPVDSDIQWTADKGEPIFDPSYGASVELDFGKPFVKENTAEAKKVTVTAAYTGSACVEKSPRTKDVVRIYLDFWIAETEDSEDDALIVRDENAQPAADDKKVIHWAKVLVKHSASTALPLKLESIGEKILYFYGEQQNPNQLPEDPPLEETLEKEYADGEWFWIGTEEKGTGQGKFKAQADPGTGFKDAPEEKTVNLLPVEVAPDKLASNGDFNEGDTGEISAQTTGAKADNRNQTLIAARDSADGSISAGDLVTEDLHEGWFGLLPAAMPDEFFDGATITITKLDKTDPATGEREEGGVRFFATWGENEEVVIDHNDPFIDSMFPNGSAPKDMVGKVYGANKTIPSGAKFWIEGVSLGKITLEWRYQKGDIDIKHEQTFEIVNDWSKDKWQKAVRDEIYLDSYTSSSGSAMNGSSTQGVDTDQYAVANDFLPNRPYIYSVYEYYAKLHRDEPGKFLWAGLAKQAGAPVYAGLSDAQNGRTGIAIATFGIIDAATLRTIQDILIDGNLNIYKDLAYQFVAYRTGGIDSIEYLFEQGEIGLPERTAWQKIDEGGDVSGGNQDLLRREQFEILRQTYIDLDDLADGKVSWMFSLLAKNPVPLGLDFQDVVPSGNVAIFNDRWQWITNSGNGMWPLWMGKSEAQRLQFSNRVITSYADTFNLVAPLR